MSDSITFKLPPRLRKELERLATAEGRSLSDYLRRHFAAKTGVPLEAPGAAVRSRRKRLVTA